MATQPGEPPPSHDDGDGSLPEQGSWNAGDTNNGDRSLRAARNSEHPDESEERQRVEVDMRERPGWQTRGSGRPSDGRGFDQERYRHSGFGQSGAASGYGNQGFAPEPQRPGADQVHGDLGYGNQSHREQRFGGDHGYGPKGSGSASSSGGASSSGSASSSGGGASSGSSAPGRDATPKEAALPPVPPAPVPRP